MNRTWKPSSRWWQLKHFLKKNHPEPWGNFMIPNLMVRNIFQTGWFNHQLSHEATIVGSPGSDPDQRIQTNYTPWKLTWQWKIDLFEDVFPIEHGDFPMLCWFSGRVCASVFLNTCSPIVMLTKIRVGFPTCQTCSSLLEYWKTTLCLEYRGWNSTQLGVIINHHKDPY